MVVERCGTAVAIQPRKDTTLEAMVDKNEDSHGGGLEAVDCICMSNDLSFGLH